MVRLDKKGIDTHGVQWFTEGYLYASVVIAKDNERKEIIDWIEKHQRRVGFLAVGAILSFIKKRGAN